MTDEGEEKRKGDIGENFAFHGMAEVSSNAETFLWTLIENGWAYIINLGDALHAVN